MKRWERLPARQGQCHWSRCLLRRRSSSRLLLVALSDFHAKIQAALASSDQEDVPTFDFQTCGRMPSITPMPTVHVDLAERSYDVIVAPGALANAAEMIHAAGIGTSRVAVISDETVAAHHSATLLDSLAAAGGTATLHTVPAGESSKSLAHPLTVCS